MKKIKGVLSTHICNRCGNDLLTSVIAVPKSNILFIQYSKYCEIHGTITSAIEEELI